MTGCSSSSATTAAGTSALSTRPGPTRWAGHARSPWQIMADTLVERVTGQTTATAVPVQVHLVLPDRVLLGQAEDAAELHGYGPIPRRARPRAHPRRVRAHELAAAPRHHPGYRPPRRDGLTGLGVPRRNRPADPAPRPGLPHAVVRRPGAHVDHVQAHQDGGPPTRPTGKACASPATTPNKRPAGTPGSDQDDDTRWRPPPLPATPTDPEPPQPGQQHLHWPRQARPRVRRPPPVRRLSDAGVGGRG